MLTQGLNVPPPQREDKSPGYFKLPISVNVIVNGYLSLY